MKHKNRVLERCQACHEALTEPAFTHPKIARWAFWELARCLCRECFFATELLTEPEAFKAFSHSLRAGKTRAIALQASQLEGFYMSRKQPRSLASHTHIHGVEIEDIEDETPEIKPVKAVRKPKNPLGLVKPKNPEPKKVNKTAVALGVFKAEIKWIKALMERQAASAGKAKTDRAKIQHQAKLHTRKVQLNALEAVAAELAGKLGS